MARSFNLGGGEMKLHPQLFGGDQPEDVLGADGPLMTAFNQMTHPGNTHRLMPLGEDVGSTEADDVSQTTEFSLVRAYFVTAMHNMERPSGSLDFRPVILTAVDDYPSDALLRFYATLLCQQIAPVSPVVVYDDIKILNASGVRLTGAIATLRPTTESDTRSSLAIDQDVLVVPKALDEPRLDLDADTARLIAENNTAAFVGASVARAMRQI